MNRIAVIALLAATAVAQTPKQPTLTPQMCSIQQPSPVSKSYINYCIKVSPDKYPRCNQTDPYEMQEAVLAGHGAYLEVLDCSWHPGKNPREITAQTPAPKPAPAPLAAPPDSWFYGPNTFHTSASNVFTPPPPCGYGGTWDEEKKVCAIHVNFGMDNDVPAITCSPVARDSDGTQHMVCWYTPIPEHKEPK